MKLLHRLSIIAFCRDRLGFDPDPHQRRVLRSRAKRSIRLWARQVGKSTCCAAECLYEAEARPGSDILVFSPSQRQSTMFLDKARGFLDLMDNRAEVVEEESRTMITTSAGSRIIALPDSPDRVRGFSSPALVICDEAARLSDATYEAVRPLLMHGGRLVLLSTPAGKRGFFSHVWHEGGDRWERTMVRAADVKRVDPDFLTEERQSLPEFIFRQEYEVAFIDGVNSLFTADDLEALLDDSVEPLFAGNNAVLGPPPTAEQLAALLNSAGGSA